ncbi:orotidine-5'-monophosphate decarboxylase [Fomitiporia mediterranea MF3/22]|uniref:orotidine-5'-monophosphate decarboxylase n=1 Tax=Fomitiporia mediterranea (strain MF3/22) TaxID=694068 RepID=UPI000440844C|nr:orotidine-5'-monophosphate decarboxylase [Fomitiporia mediterranea MF3/22]EJD01226.1 orotidine-5'-monophosphate decarboxylase [Fomitiporia mediterranea MF3/22]
MTSVLRLTYGERAARHSNPAAKALLETIERKKSNLCVSVDVSKKANFLSIIDAVGPYTCLIKTHIDIIEDFDDDLIEQLQELSRKHDFLIFEDRKFADIGNTVTLQYSSGVQRIASWAHITNAHAVPGPSIISGLSSVGLPLGRGLILLAEMSTKGSLARGEYTEEAVRMARANRNFVFGFIAQRRMEGIGLNPQSGDTVAQDEDFIILTPGVGLQASGDSLGQQYKTPRAVVVDAGCDVIIVGRGIYGKSDSVDVAAAQKLAEVYRDEGWRAYEERLKSHRN